MKNQFEKGARVECTGDDGAVYPGTVLYCKRGSAGVKWDCGDRTEVSRRDLRPATETILTGENGVPFGKPERVDFASDLDFTMARHAYGDAVATTANAGFDSAWRAALGDGR